MGDLVVWELASGKELFTVPADQPIRSVAWSPDGKTIATGEFDSTARLRDPGTGQVRHTLRGHEVGVCFVAFTPDSKTLVTGGLDNTIKLWDVDTGKEKRTLKREPTDWAWVWALAIDSTGKRLAAGHQNGMLRLWEVPSGNFFNSVSELPKPVRSVAFGGNDSLLTTGDQGATVRIYDSAGLRESDSFCLGSPQGVIGGVCFTPDGRLLATGNGDGTLTLIEIPARKEKPAQ